MAKKDYKMKSIHDAVWIIIALVIVLVAWLILINLIPEKGDNSVNTTNSIFSALAFAGVIVAIYLQRNELILQRVELESTRGEFEVQNQTLRKQRFENTFFNLLTLHHSIVDKISVTDNDLLYHASRGAIRLIYNEFADLFKVRLTRLADLSIFTVVQHKSTVFDTFGSTYQRYEEHISHYLKNFSTMVRLIKNSDLISDNDRELYFTIVRSQINSYEIVFLFYYFNAGLGMHEKELFDDLKLGQIINSDLLPDIRHSFLFDPPEVVMAALLVRKQ